MKNPARARREPAVHSAPATALGADAGARVLIAADPPRPSARSESLLRRFAQNDFYVLVASIAVNGQRDGIAGVFAGDGAADGIVLGNQLAVDGGDQIAAC